MPKAVRGDKLQRMLERLARAVGEHARGQYDRMYGFVQISDAYDALEVHDAIDEILVHCGQRRMR